MEKETIETWLRGRTPPIPAPFLPHLVEDGQGPWGVEELAARGAEALTSALQRPGRDRTAAFHLLTADAFFTYACEALVQEEDVRGALEGLLKRMGDRFS